MKRIAGLIAAMALIAAAFLVAPAPTAAASPMCSKLGKCGVVCLTPQSRMNIRVADYWDKWQRVGKGTARLKPGRCSTHFFRDADALWIPHNWRGVAKQSAHGKATRTVCYRGGKWYKIRDGWHVTLTTIKGRCR